MRFTSLLIILLVSFCTYAKELPKLLTKQPLEYIRFISDDGKITYYQKKSGSFQFSTNYDYAKLLEFDSDTIFYTQVSDQKKKVLIEVSKNQHKKLDPMKNNDLYIGDYGSQNSPLKISQGVSARLELKDTWVSSFNLKESEINFTQISSARSNKVIKLSKKNNPFFKPHKRMINPTDVIYTDINNSGVSALLFHSFTDDKTQAIFKSKSKGTKLEICLVQDSIYLGEFPLDGVNLGSTIYKVDLYNNQGFQKKSIIYESTLPDLGQMLCDQKNIYFIKAREYYQKSNIKITDLAQINLKTLQLNFLSELKFVTQVLKMDSLILIPFRDDYYIAKGKQDLAASEIDTRGKN